MSIRNHHAKPGEPARPETERFDPALLDPKPEVKSKGVASFVADKAEQATEAVGAGMESLGHTIRDHSPHQGVLGGAGEAVADKLEAGGRYLEGHGLKGMGEDLTKLVRQNPIPALLIGVGLGFLIARMMRS